MHVLQMMYNLLAMTNGTNTVNIARNLANRFYKVPSLLVRTEIESLLGLINSDKVTKTLMESLLQREAQNLGAHAGSLAKGNMFSHQVGLSFANTPERRAAFGYQILENIISFYKEPEEVWRIVESICSHYVPVDRVHGNRPVEKIVEQFIEIFINPIIDYMEFTKTSDDFVRAMMVKYKQRCEWFEKGYLRNLIETKLPGDSVNINQLENRLKTDFYKYLFDQGLDFFIETASPQQKSRVDVITAKFPNGRRLIVEAKAYDGKNRDNTWVQSGIRQAATYADNWAEPYSYLLVYNVAKDVVLEFIGAKFEGNLSIIPSMSKEVLALSINLGIDLPASKSSQIKTEQIPTVN